MYYFNGPALKQLIRVRGTTQKKLGKQIYVSYNTISGWCRGIGEPSASTLFKLAETLRVEPRLLIANGDKNEATNTPLYIKVSKQDGKLPQQYLSSRMD